MNVEKYLLFFLLLIFPASIFAQGRPNTNRTGQDRPPVEITGIVVEENGGLPVEQAAVRLINVRDSSMVAGVVSDQKGHFTLKNLRRGTYMLNISFLGLAPLNKEVRVSGELNSINLGTLKLGDDAIMLSEAVVIGKAAEVIVRNDTVEYNADSYKVAEGSVLEDLLKKMPGVEVDSDGKITVNGKEIQKILVDGKEFFSNDPKVSSKNLPSDIIDRIQVFDKKSDMTIMTGFDDGDEEATINLTIKPGMKQGWFGNAFAGYGSKDRYEGNTMINRFVNNDQFTFLGGFNNTNNMGSSDLGSSMFEGGGGGGNRMRFGGGAGNGIVTSGNAGINFNKEVNSKMTWTGNVFYSHSDRDAEMKSFREDIISQDSSSYRNASSISSTKNDNITSEFKMEWKPDTMTTIIFRPELSYSRSSRFNLSDTENFDGDMETVSLINSKNISNSEGYDLRLRLNYSKKLNNKGRVFSAFLSGGLSNSYTNEAYLNEMDFTFERDSVLDQRSKYDNTGFNYSANLSWVEPLGNNNFIQLDYRFSQNKQESIKNAYSKEDPNIDIYNRLDSAYSKSSRSDFISQRIRINFKSQREKYNYTVGLNIDPSYRSSENFVGDKTLERYSRNVLNISPNAQFNYLFSKRSNLRVLYNGRVSQPSMSQLREVEDLSDMPNITVGNPNLKPTYTNNLSVRFQNFIPEKQMAIMLMAEGNYVINDIVNNVTNLSNGGRHTTYENINGNYNGNIRFIFNTPLKNKKFSVNSMSWASYNNRNGFTNGEKNRNQNTTLMERAGIDFRSQYFDLGINGNIRFNKSANTLQPQNNLETYNYGVGGNTTIHLPLNFRIESDINYSTNSGYASGYEQKEVLWNASAAKSFLKGNQATLRFKIYDILQQRSNISQTQTANYTQFTEYNTLNSYFIVHFVYRFSIFKGGSPSAANNFEGGGPRRWDGGGGGRRNRF